MEGPYNHEYRERPPAPALRDFVACTWTRAAPAGIAHRVVPDACLDIIWRDDGQLQVAGPDTRPLRVAAPGVTRYAAVRFLPGAAPSLLGVPASALRDLRVDLADVWGESDAGRLAQELAAAPERAEEILTRTLERRARTAPPPDPLVRALVARLGHSHLRLATAAADLGVSERQLRRRCEAAVGYGPKTLDRVLRFQRFRALATSTAAPLAQLAVASGYADQAHLSREYRRLAGATPGSVRLSA